jgi:small neutral amino acid transporter SnatA (MarC family)
MSQAYSSLVVVNLLPILLQVVILLSSVLMNGAEVYASRMMRLLAPVSASALSRCSSLFTMKISTHYQLSGWLLGDMTFLAWF